MLKWCIIIISNLKGEFYMKKNIVSLILALSIITLLPCSVFAHPGRTDSNGGHYDRKTGIYHYHNGGGSSGGSSSTSSSYSSNSSSRASSPKWRGDKYWNGKKYVTGFNVIGGKKYCFDDRGKLYKNEWVTDGSGNRCYINDEGIVCTGWQTIGNNTYYFGSNGCMRTGLRKINEKVYYFEENGIRYNGWKTFDGNTYYFKKNGERATGKIKINNVTYTFSESGKLLNSSENSQATKSKLKWGMSIDEVIESQQIVSYDLSDDFLITTDRKINNCYLFDNNSLCAYGKATGYTSEMLSDFQDKLINDGWELASESTENNIAFYVKESHFTSIMYDKNSIIQLRYYDKYIEKLYKS